MYAFSMTGETEPPTRARPAESNSAGTLLARVAMAQDKQALAELFRMFGPKIKGLYLRQGVEGALAEDLSQEVMLTVWRKAKLFSPEKGAVSTWIYTIARNLKIDHLRRQSSKPHQDVDDVVLTSDYDSAETLLERDDAVTVVGQALKTLPADQREVLELAYGEDLAQTEIAERLNLPLGTVKSRMRLAYAKLKPLLEDVR